GLGSSVVFYPSFSEVFGIPAQVNTLRLYYNRDLLREVTGSDQPPATLEELLALRPVVDAWKQRHARNIVTLSLCGPYGEYLFERVSQSMTQSLSVAINPARTLGENNLFNIQGHLDGAWSLRDPAARRVLELWAEISALAPPGYLQLQREEALFNFVTGRALFFYGGSWDYAGVTQESPFSVGVAPFPQPLAGQGRWGEFSLGKISEAEGGMECILGVARDSRHPDLAIDFLRFLTSHAAATKFTEISRRISAVVQVPAPAELEALRPDSSGAFAGMMINMRPNPGGNALLQFNQNLHLLDARNRPASEAADAFTAALESVWPPALARDLATAPRSRLQIVRQADVRQTLALLRDPASPAGDLIAESALDAELALAQLREFPPSR
ncbi:MAG: extracellular solute-binding protein, partial [Burkholderiales bacterium]|nr:extracellular solute-binding protein [Opitutaceae bacterium]